MSACSDPKRVEHRLQFHSSLAFRIRLPETDYKICDRYKDCWNKDFDSGKCRSDCRAKADNDTGFEAKVDMCAACIEDKSCGGTFSCVADCGPVIAN